jgi:hypothetical protein
MVKVFARPFSSPVRATGLQQVESTDDVGVNEIVRAGDGTVDVRFSCEMNNVGNVVLSDDAQNLRLVPQVHLLEDILWMGGHISHVVEMSGVSEAVEVDESADRGLRKKTTNGM